MKKFFYPILLSLMIITGCNTPAQSPTPTATATRAPAATPTPNATPVTDIAAAETAGRAFLSAWEKQDYPTMHSLLAPSLRAGLSLEDFTSAYESPLNITTAISVSIVPQTLGIEGQNAWISFEETWHTGMFGEIRANNQLSLIKEQAQWWVNWKKSAIWPDFAEGHNFAVDYQIPPRANIYDRNGAGLAVPLTIVTVGVIPEQIENEGAVIEALVQVLNKSAEEIRATYAGQPANWYIPIGDITGEENLTYDAALSQPGIERRDRTGRLYPLEGVASHVVGWVSPIPIEGYDLYRQQGYRGDEWVGISGLEAWGERILAGQNGGRLYIVQQDGTYVQGLSERRPVRGRSIYTTIDRDLQHYAEQVLNNRRGAVVALDVHTGAVLAMTSGPRFDNNIFIRPTDELQRQYILNDPNRPLINRAIQGQYPSGSVFKIVTLAAALEAGNLSPESVFHCPGYWDGLGTPNRKLCWLETGHGDITLQDALSASCNVTFYEVGKILYNADPNILSTYGKALGLGQKTGLPELQEAAGLMPGPEWKKQTYNTNWALGDAANLAIGQGYLVITPLQIARMVAAVANGGTLYRPYLVDHLGDANGTTEQVATAQAVGRLPISANNLAIIQQAMYGTTTAPVGTATHRFYGLPVAVAGKTGTAEHANQEDDPHSWFAGYFPADAPQIAMAIIVEYAGEGSSVAAPMFRQIVELYYGYVVTPLPEPTPTSQEEP